MTGLGSDPQRQVVRVVTDGPLGHKARVLIDGVERTDVVAVELSLRAGHVNTAIVTFWNVEADVQAEVTAEAGGDRA
jgi:hypothetical protein